jgi:hypothetical protein
MIADPPPPRVEIEGQIMEYIPDAMNDYFRDGRFALFDAAVLTVRGPAGLNPRMVIYLPQPIAADSPWRRVGSKVAFQIAPEMLAPGTVIFGGAIHNLRVEEEAEAGKGKGEGCAGKDYSTGGNANE